MTHHRVSLNGFFGGSFPPLYDDRDPSAEAPTSSPRQYVAYPLSEELRLPAVGDLGQDVLSTYQFDFGQNEDSRREFAAMPSFWFELGEIDFGEIVLRRDGSVEIHVSDHPDPVLVPAELAPYVRVFADPNAALAYANAQNVLLSMLHRRWVTAAADLKQRAEAQIGRLTIATNEKA